MDLFITYIQVVPLAPFVQLQSCLNFWLMGVLVQLIFIQSSMACFLTPGMFGSNILVLGSCGEFRSIKAIEGRPNYQLWYISSITSSSHQKLQIVIVFNLHIPKQKPRRSNRWLDFSDWYCIQLGCIHSVHQERARRLERTGFLEYWKICVFPVKPFVSQPM